MVVAEFEVIFQTSPEVTRNLSQDEDLFPMK